jgi:hypothetical protein
LEWEDVVEYAFLSEFDLLCDGRDDVKTKSWSAPSAHVLMDRYFKVLRAREEIKRLNVEIKRVMTYMRDESEYLQTAERALRQSNPRLAHQIMLHREERGRFNQGHAKCFAKLALHAGFSGSLVPGDSMHRPAASIASDGSAAITQGTADVGDCDDSDSDEDDAIMDLMYKVLSITMDSDA